MPSPATRHPTCSPSPPNCGYKRRPPRRWTPQFSFPPFRRGKHLSPPLPADEKMTERFPDDGAAANVFGRRHLQEPEARLLYEAEYPTPPDMWVPGAWRLSAGGVLVPPVPEGAARRAEIVCIRSSMTEEQQNEPRYAADSHHLWTSYFQRRNEEQIATTNGVMPRGRTMPTGGVSGGACQAAPSRPSSTTSRPATSTLR